MFLKKSKKGLNAMNNNDEFDEQSMWIYFLLDLLMEELVDYEDEETDIEFILDLFDEQPEDDEEVLYISDDKIDDIFDKKEDEDMVNSPSHYNQMSLETIEKFLVLYGDNPDYVKGAIMYNIVKYTDRAPYKGTKEQDEEKVEYFIDLFTDLFPGEAEMYNKYRKVKGK